MDINIEEVKQERSVFTLQIEILTDQLSKQEKDLFEVKLQIDRWHANNAHREDIQKSLLSSQSKKEGAEKELKIIEDIIENLYKMNKLGQKIFLQEKQDFLKKNRDIETLVQNEIPNKEIKWLNKKIEIIKECKERIEMLQQKVEDLCNSLDNIFHKIGFKMDWSRYKSITPYLNVKSEKDFARVLEKAENLSLKEISELYNNARDEKIMGQLGKIRYFQWKCSMFALHRLRKCIEFVGNELASPTSYEDIQKKEYNARKIFQGSNRIYWPENDESFQVMSKLYDIKQLIAGLKSQPGFCETDVNYQQQREQENQCYQRLKGIKLQLEQDLALSSKNAQDWQDYFSKRSKNEQEVQKQQFEQCLKRYAQPHADFIKRSTEEIYLYKELIGYYDSINNTFLDHLRAKRQEKSGEILALETEIEEFKRTLQEIELINDSFKYSTIKEQYSLIQQNIRKSQNKFEEMVKAQNKLDEKVRKAKTLLSRPKIDQSINHERGTALQQHIRQSYLKKYYDIYEKNAPDSEALEAAIYISKTFMSAVHEEALEAAIHLKEVWHTTLDKLTVDGKLITWDRYGGARLDDLRLKVYVKAYFKDKPDQRILLLKSKRTFGYYTFMYLGGRVMLKHLCQLQPDNMDILAVTAKEKVNEESLSNLKIGEIGEMERKPRAFGGQISYFAPAIVEEMAHTFIGHNVKKTVKSRSRYIPFKIDNKNTKQMNYADEGIVVLDFDHLRRQQDLVVLHDSDLKMRTEMSIKESIIQHGRDIGIIQYMQGKKADYWSPIEEGLNDYYHKSSCTDELVEEIRKYLQRLHIEFRRHERTWFELLSDISEEEV